MDLEFQGHQHVKDLFKNCSTKELIYQKIIELGKTIPKMPEKYKTPEYLVSGCQSIVYLHAELVEKKVYFTAFSEALISAGLAALLIEAYQGQSPEMILKVRPTFLEDLQIPALLSPGRSNGLASMYLRMQKIALNFLL